MEPSEIAAWWGAVIASVVLLWDIFKWLNKGARVFVNATPNMQTVNHATGKLDKNKLISVAVNNIGDLPTTITHLIIINYSSYFNKLIDKPSTQAVIMNQGTGYELPHLLSQGSRWVGNIDQEDVITKLGNEGILYCGVIHTLRKKPVLVRVKLK